MSRIVDRRALVLDACCLINLYVSGRFPDLITSLEVPVFVAEVVWRQEVPTLHDTGNDDADRAVSEGLIHVAGFRGSEADNFVDFAAELGDDGEAASCAIAFGREFAIATDDRAAARFVLHRSPSSVILTSPELVKHWADQVGAPLAEVREVLLRIRDTGRYVPGPTHDLSDWWKATIS